MFCLQSTCSKDTIWMIQPFHSMKKKIKWPQQLLTYGNLANWLSIFNGYIYFAKYSMSSTKLTLLELLISIVSTMHVWNEQTNQLFIYNFTSFFTVRCRQRRLSLFPLNIDPVWLAISNTQIVCSYGYALNSDHLLTFFLQKYQYRYILVVIKNSSYKRIFWVGSLRFKTGRENF